MFLNQELTSLKSKSFWQNFAPEMHIESLKTNEFIEVPNNVLDIAKKNLNSEGYFQMKQEITELETQAYANLIKRLVSLNILPVFCYVFDEFWLIQAKAKNLINSILGENYRIRPCLWAWHLNPANEEAGWKPHRDGNIDSLNPDLSPRVLSLWIPLTDANPLNGCMYMVPMNRESQEPHRAKGMDFNLPDVRALPAQAGDMLIWNHWVIHWGAQASKRAAEARISLGFELEAKGSNIINAPLLDPLELPSFEDRLKIIAYQIHQYTHMYEFSREMLEFAHNILDKKCLTTHLKNLKDRTDPILLSSR
jgi:hypothetical protein